MSLLTISSLLLCATLLNHFPVFLEWLMSWLLQVYPSVEDVRASLEGYPGEHPCLQCVL